MTAKVYAKAPGRASALDGCSDSPLPRLGTLFVSLRVGSPTLAAELHEVLVNCGFGSSGIDTYGDPLADGVVSYEYPVESFKLPFESWELWFRFSPELTYGIAMRGTPATARRPNDPP